MKKCRYPTTLPYDFDSALLQESRAILSLPIPSIYYTLINVLDENENMKLLCILRLLLDAPTNENAVTLIGWYIINGLVRSPTIFLYINKITTKILNEPAGINLLVLFVKSIITKLPKYCTIVKYLLSIPSIQFTDNDLHIILTQISRESFQFENCDNRHHFIIPKQIQYYPEIRTITAPPTFPSQMPLIQLKPNIFSSIEFAATLKPDEQRLYCVNLCLTYSPPSVRLHFPPLLYALCGYTRLLLFDSSHLAWNAFEIHPQLERMGNWIGAISVEHGPPPPLYLLNIPLLIRECAATGSLGHCLIFLIAMFSRATSHYAPPNPLTVSILSILSAVFYVDGIRNDIKDLIVRFCDIFKTDISFYYVRGILIPQNSFDCSAQFLLTNQGGQSVFQPASLCSSSSGLTVNDDDVVNAYFHYVPDRSMLPNDLQDLCRSAQRVEKYYFVDGPTHVFRSSIQGSDQEMLQCFVSLALADSPVLAKIAAQLFQKTTKKMTSSIDLCPLFRCAFPNRYILSACLKRHCFAPEDVNSLFSELLTNDRTCPIAKPMISSFMSMCFEYCQGYAFTSVREILGIPQKPIQPPLKILPPPLKMHTALLKSFLDFATGKNEMTRSDFLSKISNSSVPQLISLFSFVFGVTKKQKSPTCMTKTDYSAIDGLCAALGRSASRINYDKLVSMLFAAITSIAPESPPLLLFRLVHGLFTSLQLKSRDEMIDLLNNLSPTKMPSFSICWIQLVMHKAALPHLIRTNENKSMQFCLNFVLIIIQLLIDTPEVFYRGVVKVLMTMSSIVPNFFSFYYQLIIERLPLRYIQIRNIVLRASVKVAATTSRSLSFTPIVGFNMTDSLIGPNDRSIIKNIDNIFSTGKSDATSAQAIADILNEAGKAETTKDDVVSTIFWQFVLYSIKKASDAADDIIITRASNKSKGQKGEKPIILGLFNMVNKLLDEKPLVLIYNAIVDQMRYSNQHTIIAAALISDIFENSNNKKKELIVLTLVRRHLCTTQPPKSVRTTFKELTTKHQHELTRMFRENGELNTFKQTLSIIDYFEIKKSISKTDSF